MFDPRFNNFQNTVQDQSTEINPYQDQYFGQNDKTPYREGMSIPMPQPMPGNVSEDNMYPLESSLASPGLNTPVNTNGPITGYAQGGQVRKGKKKQSKFPNLYPSLAEMIREQGGEEDTILAHINPLEAQILGLIANGGRINPVTGLPQFGLLNKPGKWLKGSVGGMGGTILGNMILPGIGGVIGGALGGAAGSAIRGRKDYLQAGLRGAAMGTALPTAASLLGSGASSLGMNSAGNFLSNYGAQNAILPSLGLGAGGVSAGGSGATSAGTSAVGEAAKKAAEKSWFDKMIEPKNLLTAATLAGSFMNRPKEKKEKSPEQIANEEKRYRNAARLSRAEIEADEAAEFLKKQANYRLRHNLAEGESLLASPVYRKVNSPEDYRKKGRWLEYNDNPNFSGNPLMMKMGGKVPEIRFEEEETEYPSDIGFYLKGHTGGQEDKIPAKLSDGEYVIPADVVSHAGDGNNEAGAMKFDALLKNIRKAKVGSIHLPPKAKSLASYMTR